MTSNNILIGQIRRLIESYARVCPDSGISIPDFQFIQSMNHNQLIGLRAALSNAISAKAPGRNLSELGVPNLRADRGNYVPIISIAGAELRYPDHTTEEAAD